MIELTPNDKKVIRESVTRTVNQALNGDNIADALIIEVAYAAAFNKTSQRANYAWAIIKRLRYPQLSWSRKL